MSTKFKQRTLKEIASMICGDHWYQGKKLFLYRTDKDISGFFKDCDTDYIQNGTSRVDRVISTLEYILTKDTINAASSSNIFSRVIKELMGLEDTQENSDSPERSLALEALNSSLIREDYEAFYGKDNQCYLKHLATGTTLIKSSNMHRPFSQEELSKKNLLSNYLDQASEDNLIELVLLPLFRQLGFQRITVASHKDKALEYGKDIWMKYSLPTQHVLYFGIQVKKGKLDASGNTKATNANIAEVYNQTLMMLGHEIFDPEVNNSVLVDHAFIIAGGEITKQAHNWLVGRLDKTMRRQLIFMGREDILNLFITTNLEVPSASQNLG